MKMIFFLPVVTLLAACTRNVPTACGPAAALPDTFIIAPVYGDSVYFAVNSWYTDRLEVRGQAPGFTAMEKKTHEVFFQRFVSKKGTFRKIHAVGTAMESVKAMGGDSVRTSHFDQYVEFDELGIFNGAPVDPVSLVPLYPGRAVKLNEAWFPEVPVKIDMGEGLAHFMFVIDSVYRSCGNDLLARVRFRFDGDLRPALSLPGAKVTVSGSGRFTWNCTVHQRRDTHLSAVYMAAGARDTVRRFITAEDSLAVYRERRLF